MFGFLGGLECFWCFNSWFFKGFHDFVVVSDCFRGLIVFFCGLIAAICFDQVWYR